MKQWKQLISAKWMRNILILIQAVAAGCLCFCILSLLYWTAVLGGFRDIASEFTDTSLFFRQVDLILQHKIRGRENARIFETDGKYDPNKMIDIQSFGQKNVMVQDLNTTYLLSDLLVFYENGGRDALHQAILDAITQAGPGHEAGELLNERSSELETILPITDISLAECSRWYSNPSDFYLETCQKLDEVCETIGVRYAEYTGIQEESWAPEAPCNLLYYLENTASGDKYTNMPASSWEEAQEYLDIQAEYDYLFEGERNHAIMTAMDEYVLSDAALEWFSRESFLGSNEKVMLGVNQEWPAGDELQRASFFFLRYGEMVTIYGTIGAVSLTVLLVCLVLTLAGVSIRAGMPEGTAAFPGAGGEKRKKHGKGNRKREAQKTKPPVLYRMPVELLLAAYTVAIVIYILLIPNRIPQGEQTLDPQRVRLSLAATGAYLILLSLACNLWGRRKKNALWSGSITRMLFRSWRQVTATRLLSGRFLIIYVMFFAMNVLLLILFGQNGVFPVLVLDIMALLYLLRDLVGKQNVYEGIHQISQGDLTYKIDTSTLQGETLEMARAINEMGDGLQEAVDSMLKNERLKSELITNVSHDLKTPLTSIVNYVDLLKRENPQGEKVQEYLAILEQKSQRLKQLTEDLVEASRINTGNISLDMVRLPFGSLLEQAVGEFSDRFEECSLTLERETDPQPLYITADGSQLWRVIENLMGNICKYAQKGSCVGIRLSGKEGRAVLVLENTSAQELDMPADELTGRFVRGDRSRHTEGSGLGLSIATSLTSLMGGELVIETQGYTFRAILSFPLS